MKQSPKRWPNLLLLVLVSGVSLWLADRVFISYERSQLIPSLPKINGSGAINLSALKYNDSLVTRESETGEFRILSFGDSYTYSVMQPEWSYNGILQAQLQESIDQYQIRVINLGEPATGTRQFRKAYDFWSQVLEHDAVLFHIFLGNDVLDDAYINASVDWSPNEAVFRGDNPILEAGNRRVPQKYPLRMLDFAYAWLMSGRTNSGEQLPEGYNWAGLTDFDPETFQRINFKYLENFDPSKLPSLLAGYEQVLKLLERAQEISESGTRVAIVLGPAEPQVDDELRLELLTVNGAGQGDYDLQLAQRIIKALRDKVAPQVNLIDLTASFRARRAMSGEKLYFRRNTHWDKEGNDLAGNMIANELKTDWFGLPSIVVSLEEDPVYQPLISDTDIENYVGQLLGGPEKIRPDVSGAARAVQMFDGVIGQPDNWAIAPLNQPILLEFVEPHSFSAMHLHLYQDNGRQYRFTVDAMLNGQWQSVADHSQTAVGGMLEIELSDMPVSAIRIIGLYNSSQESNPANTFLHISELEFVD
ncbi:MAG: hypothetical protein ACI9CB_002340 [Rhodothermales bacterium]|jgi:hypothetical protein